MKPLSDKTAGFTDSVIRRMTRVSKDVYKRQTLPDNIRLWARRNLAVARSQEVSPEERRHAQRALSIMMNVQWKSNYFEAIDPVEARKILDEELYGMERVKQRIMETIIQINRTHTLPAYGLSLIHISCSVL